MQNVSRLAIALVASLVVYSTLGKPTLAGDQPLLQLADYMPQEQEAVLLNADERRILNLRRGDHFTKSASVVSVNPVALDATVLTLVTPDGLTVRYVGEKKRTGTLLVTHDFWIGHRIISGNSALGFQWDAYLSTDTRRVMGRIPTMRGTSYVLQPLSDRYHVMIELRPDSRAL